MVEFADKATAKTGFQSGRSWRRRWFAGTIVLVVCMVGLGMVTCFAVGTGPPSFYQAGPEVEYRIRTNQELRRIGDRVGVNPWSQRAEPMDWVKRDRQGVRVRLLGDRRSQDGRPRVGGGGVTMLAAAAGVASGTEGAADSEEIRPGSSLDSPPFFAWSWAPPRVRTDLIEPLIWLIPEDDDQRLARQAQAAAARRPGLAAVMLLGYPNPLLRHPDDWYRDADGKNTGLESPWPEQGAAFVQARVRRLFDAFARAGGRIDYLVLDYEDGLGYWSLSEDKRAAAIRRIVDDPRFAALIGDDSWGTLADWRRWAQNPVWAKPGVLRKGDPNEGVNPANGQYITWSVLMDGAVNVALNRAVFAPLRAHFPDAHASNYESCLIQRRYETPERNGHRVWYWGVPLFGDVVSPAFYGIIGQFADLKLPEGHRIGKGPFQALLCEINYVRAIRRSSDVEIRPWVPRASAEDSQYQWSPYWRELILHLGLTGVRRFLYFNPISKRDPPPDRVLAADDQAMHDALAELSERVGVGGHTAGVEPIAWGSALIASGWARPDATVLWRVTLKPGIGQARVIPGGQILTPPEGEVGVWYTSPAGEEVSFEAVTPAP